MWSTKKWLTAGICFLPVASFAQLTGQDCESLARTIASGYDTYWNKSRLDTLKYVAKCEQSGTSQSGSIGITAKGFDLDGSYGTAQSAATCATEKSTLSSDDEEYRTVKRVFNQGVEVVSQCIAMAGRSWNIKSKPFTDAVSINIANLAPGGGILKSVDIISSSKMVCKGAPKKFPVSVKQDGLSFLCTRTPKTSTISGTTVTEASESTINLQLAEGPIAIVLPGYSGSALKLINEQILSLQKQNNEQRSQLTSLLANIKAGHGNAVPLASLPATSGVCPNGSYMVGINYKADGGGCCGIISAVQPVCKTLLQ